MVRNGCRIALGLALGGWFVAASAVAAPPWEALLPFKRVEANPNNPYRLTRDHGPWLILAASFSGDNAERQAHELVLELRSKFDLVAYTHQQTYDFTQPVEGIGYDEEGNRKQMRYRTAERYDSYAVLVGEFPSVEDPNLEKSLDKLKHAFPQCLDLRSRPQSTQRFAGLRNLYRRVNDDPEKRQKGPMGNAFATRNFTGERVDGYMGLAMHRGLGPHSRGATEAIRGLGALAHPRTFGHGGVGSSYCWADPESGVSFAFLSNCRQGNEFHEPRMDLLSNLVHTAIRDGA